MEPNDKKEGMGITKKLSKIGEWLKNHEAHEDEQWVIKDINAVLK